MGASTCEFCAEDIDPAATRCRACGEAVGRGLERGWRWDGQQLLVDEGARLPCKGCLLCETTNDVAPRLRAFVYTPPWVWIGLVGGLLPLVLLALIGQRRASVSLPLCGGCLWSIRLWNAGVGLFAVIGLFGLPILGGVVLGAALPPNDRWLGVLGGFVAWLVGVIALKVVADRRTPRCTYVEKGAVKVITLALPDPDVGKAVLG